MKRASDLSQKLNDFSTTDAMASSTMQDYFKHLTLPSGDEASRELVYNTFVKIAAHPRWREFDGNDEFKHIDMPKAMAPHAPQQHTSACAALVDLLVCVGDMNEARTAVEKLGDSPQEIATSNIARCSAAGRSWARR
eukprot:6821416-Pyramimonas_sp.AAC.1